LLLVEATIYDYIVVMGYATASKKARLNQEEKAAADDEAPQQQQLLTPRNPFANVSLRATTTTSTTTTTTPATDTATTNTTAAAAVVATASANASAVDAMTVEKAVVSTKNDSATATATTTTTPPTPAAVFGATVQEVQCGDPNCAPIDTVVTLSFASYVCCGVFGCVVCFGRSGYRRQSCVVART
jgi:hypothetical protein